MAELQSSSGSRRADQLEATRRALIAAGRQHFGAVGYAAAEVGAIAAQARVTTGALYHHFGNKLGLFTAVAESLEQELVAVALDVPGETPWARLRAGLHALIDHCAAEDMRRILLVEAPQVIGPAAWREIELRYAYGAMRAVLGELMAAGELETAPVEFLARALLVLLGEAAAEIAVAETADARRQVYATIDRMLDALETRRRD
ncbi:MAG: TetR/AcrR family transcriptional regulator [Sphingomonas sp.]